MILLIFILAPLWLKILNSRAAVLITCALLALSIFSARPIDNLNPLLSLIHFMGVFLLGGVAARYRHIYLLACDGKLGVAVATAATVGFIWSGTQYLPHSNGAVGFFQSLFTLNYHQLGKIFALIILLQLFERYFSNPHPLFKSVASRSFAIFFIHGYVIFALERSNFFVLLSGLPFLISLAAKFVIVLALSFFVIEVTKLILKDYSRYAIGY